MLNETPFLFIFYLAYTAVGLLIMPKIKAIIAITNNMCIMPEAAYTNTPNAQPMSSITAMIYNSEFMVLYFN